jgi:Ser/Thr protein kinase RdoA (MazF antagonist)
LEKRIKDRLNDSILADAERRYGIAPGGIRLLDGFESFIYEFERGHESFVLRIGHSFRRTENLIRGEVDWINHLARGGASVAAAIQSENGNLVERIDDGQGECFLATAFVKAEGKPSQRSDWSPEFLERYGTLLGRMHALTKEYVPGDPTWRRPEWDAATMLEVERFLPAGEERVLERYRELKQHLGTLPRGDRDSYGLIHQDAHSGNFHVDATGRITLFDFDDCTYSWFANDIAIVLFYAVPLGEDSAGFAEAFMTSFLRGYARENRLDVGWLAEVPHFLKLREIDLYAVIHRSFDVKNLDNPWCARYMANRKERIERGAQFIECDFQGLATCL